MNLTLDINPELSRSGKEVSRVSGKFSRSFAII